MAAHGGRGGVSVSALLPQGVWRKAAWRGPPGFGRPAALLTLFVLMLLRVWDPPLLETLRGRIFDTYQRLYPRATSEYPVTIVDIDERSLKAVGQWPWSRVTLASLVDRLAERGAVAIGFDILFAEPDRLSPPRIAESISDAELKSRLAALPDNDA